MKSILIFLAGAGAGALGTWLIMRKDDDDEREYYIPENHDKTEGEEKVHPDTIGKNKELYRKNKARTSYEKFSKEEEEGLKQAGKKYGEDFKGGFQHFDISESEKNTETEPGNPEDEDEEIIHVISKEQFCGERRAYEKITLYFYNPEEILADEDCEPVDNVEAVIGTEWKDRVGEFEPFTVYIRNNSFRTDYEIVVLDESYYDRVEWMRGH